MLKIKKLKIKLSKNKKLNNNIIINLGTHQKVIKIS